jgi:hypothetical protein
MGAYIGFIGLAILFFGLAFVYVRRKIREKALSDFYKEHSFFFTQNTSPKIREHLGITENPYCCQANLKLANGAQIPIYWCEWVIKTQNPGRTTASFNLNYYLAIFFAPNLVSDDFVRKAIQFADKSEVGVMQKIKDQFTLDTHYPFRAEKLADGTFLICWQMLKRREIYEARLSWLQNNISVS